MEKQVNGFIGFYAEIDVEAQTHSFSLNMEVLRLIELQTQGYDIQNRKI